MKKLLTILTLLVSCSTHDFRERQNLVQDYIKVNGKWTKKGQPYPMPDTVKTIHLFIIQQ